MVRNYFEIMKEGDIREGEELFWINETLLTQRRKKAGITPAFHHTLIYYTSTTNALTCTPPLHYKPRR